MTGYTDECLKWVLLNGVEAVELCPLSVERELLRRSDAGLPISEDEWLAVQEFFRADAKADEKRHWAKKHAANRYLHRMRKLRGRTVPVDPPVVEKPKRLSLVG